MQKKLNEQLQKESYYISVSKTSHLKLGINLYRRGDMYLTRGNVYLYSMTAILQLFLNK